MPKDFSLLFSGESKKREGLETSNLLSKALLNPGPTPGILVIKDCGAIWGVYNLPDANSPLVQ